MNQPIEVTMKTKILGRTGLEVTIIGLGTIYIGSQPSEPPAGLRFRDGCTGGSSRD